MNAAGTTMAHGCAIRGVCPPLRLWLLHAAANLLLAGLVYAWLWIPDATLWQFAASVLLGLFTVAAALTLHAATLAHLDAAHHGEQPRLWASVRTTCARLPALVHWLFLLAVFLWLVGWVEGRGSDWAAVAASWLTLKLQKPVRTDTLVAVFSSLVALVRWFVMPLFFLPLALQVARSGFSGFRWPGLCCAAGSFRRPLYLLSYVVVFVVCAYLPFRLTMWVPEVSTMTLEAASAALRFVVAYAMALSGWLILLSLTAKYDSAPLPKLRE
jgi:hypothetical protein